VSEEAAIREAFRRAASSVFDTLTQVIDSRSEADWLGGRAIASAPINDSTALDECASTIEQSSFATTLMKTEEGAARFISVDGLAGGQTSAKAISHGILIYAAANLFWSGAEFDRQSYIQSVETTLDQVLRWLVDNTQSVDATKVVALYNVCVEPGLSIDLSFGTLRSAPHNPQPPDLHRVGGLMIMVGPTDWVDAPSAMLVRTLQVTARVVDNLDGESWSGPVDLPATEVADKVALALVLACGDSLHSAPILAGEQTSEPLAGSLGGGSRLQTLPREPGIRVEKRSAGEIQKYAERISDYDSSSPLMFAGRRLLRSLNEVASEDSLVDAVVVWEALFSDKAETVFRVTAAVASTLRNEFKDGLPLLEFQKTLSKIYNARSNLVHGNAAAIRKERGQHYDYARNARRYSLRLLRLAFVWPDDVIRLDSGERSKRAILGDWPPN
jgi:hypothetical protein